MKNFVHNLKQKKAVKMKRSKGLWCLVAGLLTFGIFFVSSCDSSGPESDSDGQRDFYVGYYQENAATNPEDPTAGFIYICLPDDDGSFRGQFLFSFIGCTGGIDVGTAEGNKTRSSLSGNWRGNVDGRAIGGDFKGSASSSSDDVYSGTWTNSAGKVHIQIGDCEYYVAPNGTWTVYGAGKKDFNLNVQSGDTPTFSWTQVNGASFYLIAVFEPEEACSNFNFNSTLMWVAVTQKTAVQYGEGIPGAFEAYPDKRLESGKTYVVLVAAISGEASGDIIPSDAIIALSRESFTP